MSERAGTPIRIGYINQERGPLAFPDFGAGGRAAVSYINEELGGLDGHPIELVECITDGTPESSAACGSQMVDAGVVVVHNGVDLANGPIHPILEDAGIPMVGQAPFTPEDYGASGASFFGVGFDYFAAMVRVGGELLGADRASYLIVDTPSADPSIDGVTAVANALGMELTPIKYPPGTTDLSSAVAQALSSEPDVLLSFAAEPDMISLIQSSRDQGFDGPIVAGITRTWADALPTEVTSGTYTLSDLYDFNDLDSAPQGVREELNIFLAAMKRYQPDFPPSSFPQNTFSSMMTLYALLGEIGAEEVVPQTIVAALDENIDRHKYMGTTYNCSTALDSFPTVCSAGVLPIRFEDGQWITDGEHVSGLELLGG